MSNFLSALPYLIAVFAITSPIFAAVELFLKTKGVCGILSLLSIICSVVFAYIFNLSFILIMIIIIFYSIILALMIVIKKRGKDAV